jgi:hypothetical protein
LAASASEREEQERQHREELNQANKRVRNAGIDVSTLEDE